MRYLATIGLLVGCYSPQLAPCEVQCGSNSPCPADLSCGSDDYCHAAGDTQTCIATLTIELDGNGNGHVTSTPTGIDCSNNSMTGCHEIPFALGTMITLSENHFGGVMFEGWGGDACNGSGTTTCVFTIEMSMTVHARFN